MYLDQLARTTEPPAEGGFTMGSAAKVTLTLAERGRWSEVFRGESSRTLAERNASRKSDCGRGYGLW